MNWKTKETTWFFLFKKYSKFESFCWNFSLSGNPIISEDGIIIFSPISYNWFNFFGRKSRHFLIQFKTSIVEGLVVGLQTNYGGVHLVGCWLFSLLFSTFCSSAAGPLHNSSREFSSLSFFKKALSGPPHHLLLDREGAIFLVSLKTHARKLTGYFCKNSTPPLLFLLLMKSTGPTSFFASKAFSILTYFKAIFSGMMKYDVDLS